MNADPAYHGCISESLIKHRIGLLAAEFDRLTATGNGDRITITNFEVHFLYLFVNVSPKKRLMVRESRTTIEKLTPSQSY